MECPPPHHRRVSRPRELEALPETELPSTALLRITPEGRAALAALRAARGTTDVDAVPGLDDPESEDGS